MQGSAPLLSGKTKNSQKEEKPAGQGNKPLLPSLSTTSGSATENLAFTSIVLKPDHTIYAFAIFPCPFLQKVFSAENPQSDSQARPHEWRPFLVEPRTWLR